MPEMDIVVRIAMIALVGVLAGGIVLYHVWLDRRLARERAATLREAPASEPGGARRTA